MIQQSKYQLQQSHDVFLDLVVIITMNCTYIMTFEYKKNHIAAVSLCKSYESSRYYIISAILETNCFKLWILVSAFIIFFYFIIELKCEGNEGNQTNFNNPSGCFELSRFLFQKMQSSAQLCQINSSDILSIVSTTHNCTFVL